MLAALPESLDLVSSTNAAAYNHQDWKWSDGWLQISSLMGVGTPKGSVWVRRSGPKVDHSHGHIATGCRRVALVTLHRGFLMELLECSYGQLL